MHIENAICVWEIDAIRCSFFGEGEMKYYTIFEDYDVFLLYVLDPQQHNT